MPTPQPHTLLVIVGPTAVGKTDIALRLARQWGTAIVSADSRQCFREMNIGVAKPTAGELAEVPHHFINSHSITDAVDAAVYEQFALDALTNIFTKHDKAVVVGGTGLYINALCYGVDDMPQIPPLIRQAIRTGFEADGLAYVHAQLALYDPQLLATTHERQNPHRMMRALEFAMATGQSIRHFQKGKPAERPFNIITVGLELPKETLISRIDARADEMMAAGLYEEVQQLFPYKHLNALQTVGYREFFEHFSGRCSLDAAVEFIKRNTRHYAKRQLTWFKKDENVNWFSADDFDGIESFINKKLTGYA